MSLFGLFSLHFFLSNHNKSNLQTAHTHKKIRNCRINSIFNINRKMATRPIPISSLKAKGYEDRLIISNLGRQNQRKETLLCYDPVDKEARTILWQKIWAKMILRNKLRMKTKRILKTLMNW